MRPKISERNSKRSLTRKVGKGISKRRLPSYRSNCKTEYPSPMFLIYGIHWYFALNGEGNVVLVPFDFDGPYSLYPPLLD
jgi:hypothetical protein